MARPRKKGLEYFPFDIDLFEDDKIFDVQNEYGPLGEVIYIRLLCLVYRNGYYYRFDSIDKLAAMMIKSIGNRWAKDKKTVKEVILYLAKINLFSSELMQSNVITSRGIQERYLSAVERRQSTIEEYSLLEKNDIHEGFKSVPENKVSVAETLDNVTETSVNVSSNATKESKGKKSKENESRGEESSSAQPLRTYGEFGHIKLTDTQYDNLVQEYGTANIKNYIRKMDDWLEEKHLTFDNCYIKLRQWLDKDGIKKADSDGFDAEKYKVFINNV